jgi:hypothetical protein
MGGHGAVMNNETVPPLHGTPPVGWYHPPDVDGIAALRHIERAIMRLPWPGIMSMSQVMDAMRSRTYTRTNADGTHDRLMRPQVWLGIIPLASRQFDEDVYRPHPLNGSEGPPTHPVDRVVLYLGENHPRATSFEVMALDMVPTYRYAVVEDDRWLTGMGTNRMGSARWGRVQPGHKGRGVYTQAPLSPPPTSSIT